MISTKPKKITLEITPEGYWSYDVFFEGGAIYAGLVGDRTLSRKKNLESTWCKIMSAIAQREEDV